MEIFRGKLGRLCLRHDGWEEGKCRLSFFCKKYVLFFEMIKVMAFSQQGED